MGEYFFTGSALFSIANGAVLLSINPRRAINRVFFGASIWIALWLLCIVMAIRTGTNYSGEHAAQLMFWLRLNASVAAYLGWFLCLMHTVLLEEPSSLWDTVKRSGGWLLFYSLVAALPLSDDFISPHPTPAEGHQGNLIYSHRGVAYLVYSLALICGGIWTLSNGLRKSRRLTGVRKIEMQLLSSIWTVTCIVIALAGVLGFYLKLDWLRRSVPIWLLFLHGLTIWTVCHHRIFDARQVFTLLGHRISTLIVLSISLLALNTFFSTLIEAPISLLLSAALAGMIGSFSHTKLHGWLGLDADLIVSMPRAQIIEWAREESNTERLIGKFESLLRERCQADFVFLYTADRSVTPGLVLQTSDFSGEFPQLKQTGFVTPEILDRRRSDRETERCRHLLDSNQLGALIATPKGTPSPSCVAVFGRKQSLRPYTYPDIQVLLKLVELMDNILAHSRLATHAARIEKMETASMFSRGLAHDLNNLATPVSTFLLHMETRVVAGTPEAEVLGDARHSIKVIQDYVRESLFFARRLVPDFQKLSVPELLTSTIKLTQNRALTRGVEVVIKDRIDLIFIADRALMLRLMQNLVLNGIDATPHGGQVTLSAGLVENDRIVFSVTDQGPGVPAELMDRIFEPYFTTKDTGCDIRGLGLGLAISLKISGLHGGELSVGNASCGGAIFTFTLPAIQQT